MSKSVVYTLRITMAEKDVAYVQGELHQFLSEMAKKVSLSWVFE